MRSPQVETHSGDLLKGDLSRFAVDVCRLALHAHPTCGGIGEHRLLDVQRDVGHLGMHVHAKCIAAIALDNGGSQASALPAVVSTLKKA